MIHSGSVEVSPKIFCFWKQPLFFISKAETYTYKMLFWASERNKTEKLLMSPLMMRKWAEFLCLQHNGYSKLVYFGMYVAISWGTQNNIGYTKQQPRNVILIFAPTLLSKNNTLIWTSQSTACAAAAALAAYRINLTCLPKNMFSDCLAVCENNLFTTGILSFLSYYDVATKGLFFVYTFWTYF